MPPSRLTQQAWLLARITDLADASRRREAARALAEALGADDLLIFVADPDVGHFLPAPGFPQTLPNGRQWHAFLNQCLASGEHRSVLPYADPDSPQETFATVVAPGAIMAFLGGRPDHDRFDEVRAALVLLAQLLIGERAAGLAAGEAAAARDAAAQTNELATALDTARGELQDALSAADREITRRKRAEAQVAALLAAEQERSQRLAQLAEACQRINTAHSLEHVLEIISDEARRIIGAHHAISSADVDRKRARDLHAVSVSAKYAGGDDSQTASRDTGLGRKAREEDRIIRRTRAEIAAEDGMVDAAAGQEHPLKQGALAAPLADPQGAGMGFVQLCDKEQGEFTPDDEAVLAQLVHVASGAIENARLYDKLRDADRRKDEFLAMLGHELRNPLAPIRSGLELLSMEQPDGGGEVVQLLHDQVDHIVRLVDDLLDVSRIVQGRISLQREPVELDAVIHQAVEAAKQLIQTRQQTLTLSLPEHPLWLNADRIRLVQVLGNFLNNAAKYSEVGGKIQLTAEAEDHGVRICVEDNGIGIDPELLPEIFDLFTQSSRSVDRSQGGLGIGLTLAKQLVELHDGSVSAYSAGRGLGSRFDIHLPLSRVSETEETCAALAPDACARRVLVVDDNVGAANMISMLVRQLGPHHVQTAHDGPSALEQAREFRPDIILLDIGLPKTDGLAVARTLRQSQAFAPTLLVALTGYGQEEDRRRSVEAGFNEHLTKPVGAETLRRLLAHQNPRAGRSAESPWSVKTGG